MTLLCCVASCKARCCARLRKEKGITFHKFPNGKTDVERLKKWIENINQEGLTVKKYTRICSRHFSPEMFDRTTERTRLWEYALPTLFDDPNQPIKNLPEIPKVDLQPSIITEFKPSISTKAKRALFQDHSYYITEIPKEIKQKLEGRIKVLRKKLKASKTTLSRYKLKIKSIKIHMKYLKNNMFTITRNF